MPRSRRRLRAALALAPLAAMAAEGGYLPDRLSPSRALARRRSQNVVATIEPEAEPRRTLCLCCHLDTSRSGLLFHPAVSRHANAFFTAQAAAAATQAAEPLIGGTRPGRGLVAAARATLAAGLAILAERELRGVDVAGANDNASGCAVAAELALACAAQPLRHTRVVLLATGCEESGLYGSRAFLASRDTSGWLFLNFDTVGGPAPLRFIRREGAAGILLDADPGLLSVAEGVAAGNPEIGLSGSERPIGLTYDSTPVLQRGGRAITLIAGNGGLPNYHWPTDTVDSIDPGTVSRAFAAGREMVLAIDRGEADLP